MFWAESRLRRLLNQSTKTDLVDQNSTSLVCERDGRRLWQVNGKTRGSDLAKDKMARIYA